MSDTKRTAPAPDGATLAAEPCPIWCTEHESWHDGTSYHRTGMTHLAGAMIDLTSGTLDGQPMVFGLHDLGGTTRECISIDDAEALAVLLLGYVAAVRSGR